MIALEYITLTNYWGEGGCSWKTMQTDLLQLIDNNDRQTRILVTVTFDCVSES